VEAADDWPKLEPIQNDLPPMQAFSEYLLPALFRPLVRDVTERMQVPMDYPGAVTMLCLAGAVNRRAVIQPKANDTGWLVVPNLWGGIIAPPGFMKSPSSRLLPVRCIRFRPNGGRSTRRQPKNTPVARRNMNCATRHGRNSTRQMPRKGGRRPTGRRMNRKSPRCGA